MVHSWVLLSSYLVPMYVPIFSLDVWSMSPSLPLFPEPSVKMWPSRSLQALSLDAFWGTFDEVFLAQPPWPPCPPLAPHPPRPVSFPWAISRWILGFSFLEIHDPLLIATLCWQYLYKPNLQDVLEELDLIQFAIVLTIVLIGQLPPKSIIASKLGFTLVYLSSCKLWFKWGTWGSF